MNFIYKERNILLLFMNVVFLGLLFLGIYGEENWNYCWYSKFFFVEDWFGWVYSVDLNNFSCNMVSINVLGVRRLGYLCLNW